MTTYNTGNPIGSTAVKDLYDNAENLDEAVNTRTAESWDDRFGVARKTWHGMEQDFQQFLINSGYENIGDYGPGLEITARNQIFRHDGELYRAGAVLELPYTTTGNWSNEETLFVAVGDAALRQELYDENLGSALLARGVVSVSTIDDLKSLQEPQIKEGLTYFVQGYFSPGDGGGGEFRWNPDSTSDEDGGLVFKATYKTTGAWERLYSTPLNVRWFGLFPSSGDASEAINLIFSLGIDTFFPSGVYKINGSISANGIRITGESGTLFQKGTDTLGETMASFYDCDVRNIEWDGNKENIVGYPSDSRIGSLLEIDRTYVSDCVFYGSESSCIAGSRASEVVIDRCHFSDFDDHAVYFSTRSKNITILNCILGEAPASNAVIQFRAGCEYITVDNCHQDYGDFDGINGHAFLAVMNTTQSHGPIKNVVINNCSYNTVNQLYFYSEYIEDYIENVLISNCRFVGNNTQPCFNFAHRPETIIKNFTVENSVFYDYTSARFGSHFSSPDEKITIFNCKFRLSGDDALLYFAHMDSIHVMNCHVEGTTSTHSARFIGVDTRCKDLLVTDSYFKEVGSGSIVGVELFPNSLSHAVSLTKIIGNTFDCTNHVISAVNPNANPFGRVLYKDNFEISNASDRVGSNFEPAISVVNRYRSARSGTSAISVHNDLV